MCKVIAHEAIHWVLVGVNRAENGKFPARPAIIWARYGTLKASR